METHEFYCLNCGELAMALPRPRGHRRPRFHRKKLYCVHCKNTINTIECINEQEVALFKASFAAGEFVEEAKESLKRIDNL